jgi:hypothetical protein
MLNISRRRKVIGLTPSGKVSKELGLRYLQSLCAMKETMKFLTDHEQHHTQHINAWFYKYGTSRV